MASNFKELRKQASSQFDALKKKLEDEKNGNQGKSYEDDRFWKLTVDKNTGIGFAVIRFLPAPKGEDVPYVEYSSFSIKGPTGKWYIENSRRSINEADPVADFNKVEWDSGDSKRQDFVRKNTKRRVNFVSNVYIVDDPSNPDNNGKVKLFRYGSKIFDKIKEKLEPEFPDEEPMNVFDLDEGANFRLKSQKKDGFLNYDRSEFDSTGPIANKAKKALSDDEMEKVWESEFSLDAFLDPKEYKDYDTLKKKFLEVMSTDSRPMEDRNRTVESDSSSDDEDDIVSGSDDDNDEVDIDEILKSVQKQTA